MPFTERMEDSDMEEGSVNSATKKKASPESDRQKKLKSILPALDFNFNKIGETMTYLDRTREV